MKITYYKRDGQSYEKVSDTPNITVLNPLPGFVRARVENDGNRMLSVQLGNRVLGTVPPGGETTFNL